MHSFCERYNSATTGVVSFFDRVLFRGSFLRLSRVSGMDSWLGWKRVLYKDFTSFVQKQSDAVKEHAERLAKAAGRPWIYLGSSGESKEELVQSMVRREKITNGLVCVLRAVEPCMSFTIRKNAETQKLELVYQERKCLFLYFYYVDREFGLLHVRLQTWFPFPIQVCINGREWLARRMDRQGLRYERSDNCFTSVEDPERAQRIADELIDTNWPSTLDRFAKVVNPLLKTLLNGMNYYWMVRQSEFATDVMFKSPQALARVYRGFARFAMDTFGSEDVMRFLGQKLHPNFKGDVTSQMTRRPEGFRVRHSVHENSIKMYDKQGSVLRIETTINNPRRFKTYRRNTSGQMAWLRMRKGVADVRSRVEVSRAANARYLEALAGLADETPISRVLDPISKPVTSGKQNFRALRPISRADAVLFALVMRAEFLIHGFRNADIRNLVHPRPTQDSVLKKRRAGKVTRLLRILRAHGLIKKIPKSSRYRATRGGIRVMGAALDIRKTDRKTLLTA